MSTNTIFIFGIILVILGTIELAAGCSCEDKSSIFIGLFSFAFGIIMIVIAYQGYSYVDDKLQKVNNSEITERYYQERIICCKGLEERDFNE